LAESVKQVKVIDGTQTATLEQMFQAHGSDIGDLKLQYTLKLDNDGYVSGLGLFNDGANSEFIVASDAVYFIDPGQSIQPFDPNINYSSMAAARDTQLVFGYAEVEGFKRFVINAPAYIPEGYITKGQIGAVAFGSIFIEDPNGGPDIPVTTAQGLLKADYIDVDNLNVASAATFYGNAQSGNFSAGNAGWRLLQSGAFEAQDAIIRGRIEADTGYIASTLQIGGTSQDIGEIAQLANDAGNTAITVDNWKKPGNTFIDGNKIFTGDAYVDTLQIKGQAVTFPRGTQAGNSVDLNGAGVNILSLTITASGAPLIITGSANIRGSSGSSDNDSYGSLALYRGGTALYGPVRVASPYIKYTGGRDGTAYTLAGGGSIQVYIPAGVTGTYYLRGYGGRNGNPSATQRSLTIMEAKR
jgi:hypothetical protein